MSDAASAKVKKAAKAKKPAAHPKYVDMIKQAVSTLKERGGSSRQAILNYITKNFKVEKNASTNNRLKVALKKGVTSGALKQVKGVGASGSFKLGEVVKAKKPKAKKPKAAKPKAVKKPKKAAGDKKPKAKKPKTPKKAAASKPKKSPAKKAAKKSPAKKAAKKSPAKKAAKKTKSPKKSAAKKAKK